ESQLPFFKDWSAWALEKYRFKWATGDGALVFFVCLLMALKRLLLLDYDLNYEEGKEIECVLRILDGKLIYRDFFWQYGPVSPYAIALLFKITGVSSILVPRLMVTAVAALTAFYSYRAARLYLPPSWAFWAALMASSGLAAREGTYGHGFAYLGMIASFYHLILLFKKEFDPRQAVYSGLFAFLAMLGKPVIFGAGAIFCGAVSIGFWRAVSPDRTFDTRRALLCFLSAALLPSLAVFGYLLAKSGFQVLSFSLFPMSSGTVQINEFYLKKLFPPLPHSPLASWVGEMNKYLVDDLRWWMIVLAFLGGAFFVAREWRRGNSGLSGHFFLMALLAYSLLIEAETVIWMTRPMTFYINMLGTFILLAIFFKWTSDRFRLKGLVRGTAFLMCVFYFFYPPIRLGAYHWTHDEPLGLKYAETVKAPPYTAKAYRTIARYVQEETRPGEPILFADYDGFIYLFSERPTLFPEDFAIMVRTSFNRYNFRYPKSFFDGVEAKIVERVESRPPSLILVPVRSLNKENIAKSGFLGYLVENWRREATLNGDLEPGPFDKGELKLAVFRPKESIRTGPQNGNS
ncbi:hypothetical protein HY732_02520, partial [Candidatus Uhrbacteria bacterium]|nr:hypothetical protein [Candidatus Uhrbacteria bacterium]